MKRLKYITSVVFASLSVFALETSDARAAITTITFEDNPVPVDLATDGLSETITAGLKFSNTISFISSRPGQRIIEGESNSIFPDNGGLYMDIHHPTDLIISRADGGTFDLISIDLAEFRTSTSNFTAFSARQINAAFVFDDNSTADAVFNIDDVATNNAATDFETFTLATMGLGFAARDIVRIEMQGSGGSLGNGFMLDNVVFDAEFAPATVPAPGMVFVAAIWMAMVCIRNRF